MAFAADGRIFITERSGSLRVMENGKLRDAPLLKLSDPFVSKGEGGLLGLALDSDFEQNGRAYVYHTYRTEEGEPANRVLQLQIGSKFQQRSAGFCWIISRATPTTTAGGSRLARTGTCTSPQVTAMIRSWRRTRIIWAAKSCGLRPAAPSPKTTRGPDRRSTAWVTAMPRGWPGSRRAGRSTAPSMASPITMSLNLIKAGANYGWPLIEGDETGDGQPKLVTPLVHSGEETWAPSGMTFITQGPWAGEPAGCKSGRTAPPKGIAVACGRNAFHYQPVQGKVRANPQCDGRAGWHLVPYDQQPRRQRKSAGAG